MVSYSLFLFVVLPSERTVRYGRCGDVRLWKVRHPNAVQRQHNFLEFEVRKLRHNTSLSRLIGLFDRRDPLKAVLSSTALLLGGLVPSHISYNSARKKTSQEWMWSAGRREKRQEEGVYSSSLLPL